jgi:hypothetical protein
MPEPSGNSPEKAALPAQAAIAAFGAGIMALTAALEHAMGRKIWGVSGRPGLWSADINSEHNSQYLTDPYTFTHILHGILFYGLFWLAAGKTLPVRMRALLALLLECGWEVLENSDMIIERYRAQTISLHYYGDSIVNSMCDVTAAMVGFLLASRLPWPVTVAGAVAVEIVMALWVRDNLSLNIIMLIHPVQAIKLWQAQG